MFYTRGSTITHSSTYTASSIVSTCPTSKADWFAKGHAVCYHDYVIMHVNDLKVSVAQVGH